MTFWKAISIYTAIMAAFVMAVAVNVALAGTIYIDTAANGSAAANFSGSTDAAAITVGGTISTFTSGTDVVVEAGKDISTGIVTTPGATQSSVYLTGATNTNKKIFWITAIAGSGGATPTLTLDSAPTCAANACGVWNIGGRAILTNASQEGALRAGDVVIFNTSPAAQAATSWTFRIAGDTTSGFAKIKGKFGVRPVLTTSGSGNAVVISGFVLTWVENLELKQTHVSTGSCETMGAGGDVSYNVKISQCPGTGVSMTGAGSRVLNGEITGAGGDGINATANVTISGNYIHDNTGDCIEETSTTPTFAVTNNVLDTCGARGFYVSGAVGSTYVFVDMFSGNTVYGNGDSGIEIVDVDVPMVMLNNIFSTNGNAAGEYNAEWDAGTAEYSGYHAYNEFYHANCQGSDTGGPACVSGLTLNAQVSGSEISTDPLLTNPSAGDFTLSASSPARAVGYPGQLLGATGLGYMSLGPEQVQSSVSSGARGLILGGP